MIATFSHLHPRAGAPALVIGLLAGALAIAPVARAQHEQTPPDPPIEGADSLGPRNAPELTPQGHPGAAGHDPDTFDPLRPSPGALVREGAFIRNGRGRMVPGDGANWIFLFDPDSRGKSEPPMILQPCIRLTEMRRLAEDKKETITFSISGQVFVYQSRNYLLPTHFTTVSADAAPSRELDAPAHGADSSTSKREGAVQSDDPRAADLLREIEKQDEVAGAAPGLRATPLPAGAVPTNLLREGLTIVQRRGRVERAAGGSWVFVTDNGPQSTDDPGADAPLRLAPCLILQEIERIVRERGERQVMSLSGQVFVYEDRNYLIPTVFQLEPDREGNLIPAQ